MTIQEGSSRRNASSAEQSQSQNVRSETKSNVPDDSPDEDKYPKETG